MDNTIGVVMNIKRTPITKIQMERIIVFLSPRINPTKKPKSTKTTKTNDIMSPTMSNINNLLNYICFLFTLIF